MLEELWNSGGLHSYILIPQMVDFWRCLKTEINNKIILGINQHMNLILYIPGILPEDLIDRECSFLSKVLLVIAKKLITINWLKPHPPNIMQWTDKVKKFIMERTTARLQLKLEKFKRRWKPIIQAIQEL